MWNFEIQFTYPWLLLLLIPAALCTFIPYFKIKKRYRRTRNRIISLVLHSIVMTLAITMLAGFRVNYVVPNENNEIILLVDVSDTEATAQENRDAFVKAVIDDSMQDKYNVGVVTFGFDQTYAVRLTQETENVFDAYMAAPLPDTSATNVADALLYTMDLFEHPQTAKIVLITDGKETDKEAAEVIRTVSWKGIVVDTVYVPSEYSGDDAQIVGITMPEQHIELNTTCEISVTVRSNADANVSIRLFDNGEPSEVEPGKKVELTADAETQTFVFKHSFAKEGLHEIKFSIESEDAVQMNNAYSIYQYVESFNKLLIVESVEGSSEALIALLNEQDETYEIKTVNVSGDQMPTSVDALREYDQVILNNIANADLPQGFDVNLKTYVETYGGGLFTLGGNDENGEIHAYNKADMFGTVYQEILPVQAYDYTPPIGVMLIIDRSGSMTSQNEYGTNYLESAKAGALACLDVLYERDYVGVMTLDDDQDLILDMTPRTQETEIREAINGIRDFGNNTNFGKAIESAGIALRAIKDKVAKLHMVVISDGGAGEQDTYIPKIRDFYNTDRITFSVIGIEMDATARKEMTDAVDAGHGTLHDVSTTTELIESIQRDLQAPKIDALNDRKDLQPIINNLMSPLVQGLEHGTGADRNRLAVKLGGFYGSRKKDGADLVLVGEYQEPLYAQWKYGKGMVGSFLCDLQGSQWSAEFMSNWNGKTFIRNVVNNLMPLENIRPNDISVTMKEDNYINNVSVFTTLQEGEYVKAELVKVTPEGRTSISLNTVTDLSVLTETPKMYTTLALNAENGYSRCDFVVKESGVYEIIFTKCDKDGNVIGKQLVRYKAFSYSEEYDQLQVLSEDELKESLTNLAALGKGTLIEDLEDVTPVFDGFVTELQKVFDPRTLFMILAIVLFLLDIAVCKFKFKWIHEIIRERKRKKEESQQ